MKKFMFLLVSLLFYGCYSSLDNSGIEIDTPGIENEIQAVLERQKTLWNEGSIEGFMEYYWKSGALTFQSGNTRLQGWQKLFSRYRKSFSGENRGTLDFTDLAIKVLSRDIAYVIGRWKLIYRETSREGLFTIIFRRKPEGWRIIHDHTS